MELSSNYVQYNVDVAKIVGIEGAVYFQQIYNINKSTEYNVTFNIRNNADIVERLTSISKDKHDGIVATLVDNKLLTFVSDDCVAVCDDFNLVITPKNDIVETNGEVVETKKRGRKPSKKYEEILKAEILSVEYVDNKKTLNNISDEYDIPTYVISKLIKQYGLVKPKTNKGDAKAGVKARLIGSLDSTSEEYIAAVSSWVDAVQDKIGLMRTDTFKYSIEALDKFADHNLDVALEVLKIATVNQYKDINWAIDNYNKKMRNINYNKPTVLNNSANKGLFDVGSSMTLDERKKYLEENISKKVF